VILYVHDDLIDDVLRRHGTGSPAVALAGEIMALVRREHTIVLTLGPQLDALTAQGPHAPFALTLGIGPAGERVARQVHARTGWFPTIRPVDLTREEDGHGGYAVVPLHGVPLATQLAGIDTAGTLAIVDDTLFSGITLRTVLDALPPVLCARTRAFCLRGVAESMPSIAARCPITVGFAAAGRLLEEVSFINASGLVRRGAIRRAGAAPLAFFERPQWLRAWFPGRDAGVLRLCRDLHAVLDDLGLGDL